VSFKPGDTVWCNGDSLSNYVPREAIYVGGPGWLYKCVTLFDHGSEILAKDAEIHKTRVEAAAATVGALQGRRAYHANQMSIISSNIAAALEIEEEG